MALNKTFTLSMPAAVANGIVLSQTPSGAGNLTINGSLSSGGIANLVTPQRVIITSAGNDSAKTFTITGTDRYGRIQVESVAGANIGVATTSHDFLTVTQIAVSAATAAAVTSGTVGMGSSEPAIIDGWINPADFSCFCTVTGAVNYSIEVSDDDLSPAWDVNTNTPDWSAATGFNSQIISVRGNIQGPRTMVRATINSGTGSIKVRYNFPFIAGRY